MIRATENQEKKFYLVFGGEWEAVVLAKDAVDASAYGLEKAFEQYGSSLMLSNCVTVRNVSDIKEPDGEEMDIDFFYVPSVLSDIGKNELATQLDEILRENEKKA